jgi:hypothetical protein
MEHSASQRTFIAMGGYNDPVGTSLTNDTELFYVKERKKLC